jgi:hypothetical protein
MNPSVHVRAAFLVFAPCLVATARAQTYLGPSPYLSRSDSPLLLTKPQLDDLEDGALDLPGVSANNGAVYGPAGNCDSVDADDGVIDGFGTAGHSWFYGFGDWGVTFSFDDSVIGSFPTSAGVVWTDGATNCQTTFEAFDANGASLGVYGPFTLGDGSNDGETAEDRFFGIAYRGGISGFKITSPSGGIELDHIQYSAGALCCEAGDTQLNPNDSLTLTLSGGQATMPGIFVAVGVGGSPTFLPIYAATFDGTGEMSLAGSVPSGLSGYVVDLCGLGFAASGKVKFSNKVALTFL